MPESPAVQRVTRLRDETRHLLIHRPASLSTAEIVRATGISQTWLTTFANGKIPNPGVVTIETLNAFLKKARANV
jgi:hypothetical protein